MPITQTDIGRRLRAAREACGLTQGQVAAHLGVSRPTVSQMEGGARAVSSLELDRLARFFGRDIGGFVADEPERADPLGALFRAQPDVVGDPAVADALRGCAALGRQITRLESLLGLESAANPVVSYPLTAPNTAWQAIRQGEEMADDERKRLGLGDAPVPDLVELLETQGIRTAVVDLPTDVSGFTLIDSAIGPFVVVNRSHHVLRRRFSFAHELAHVLADRERFGLVSRASERDNLVEMRANAFAASFLMGEDGVRQFVAGLGKGRPSRSRAAVFDEVESVGVEGRAAPGSQALQLYDVVQLAHHFGVSRIAALYRLLNLGLIGQRELDVLKAQDDSGRGHQIADDLGLPAPDHSEVRNRFRHRTLGLALEAYRREEISRGKLEELGRLLDVDRERIARLVDLTKRDDLTFESSGCI